MFEKLNNWILERHIRKLLEKYYAQFGLTLEEAKTMSMFQLMQRVEQHLEANAEKDRENNSISLMQEIKNYTKENHTQYGLSKEDTEKLPANQLLGKINDRMKNTDKEFNYYASVVNNLEQKVDGLVIENKEIKDRFKLLEADNKSLNKELAKVREENYKLKLENTLYKTNGLSKGKDLGKAISKDNDVSMAR